ncbi:MAG: hypothetical protein HY043_10900 [Verrucomicrobia bacterium]|nr:hypothetical protein [Verrucomicrobiota bacterium]
MTPILIGYFPKRTMKRPDWLKAAGVEEVCSVSNCVSEDPDGWRDEWRHNEMWVYDTPELALSIIPETVRSEFELYAYKMFPVVFIDGQQQPFEIPNLHVQPLPGYFERLGVDIVSRSAGSSFECSPLSCNHMAEQVEVTRQCLLEDVDVAFRLAAEFEAGGCEPGPYHVMEVWRLKQAGS